MKFNVNGLEPATKEQEMKIHPFFCHIRFDDFYSNKYLDTKTFHEIFDEKYFLIFFFVQHHAMAKQTRETRTNKWKSN